MNDQFIWYFGMAILYDGSIDYFVNIDGEMVKTRTEHPDGSMTLHQVATDTET